MHRSIRLLLCLLPLAASLRAQEPLRLPAVPPTLTAPAERADYLVAHYWDHAGLDDPALADDPAFEQFFVDYLSVLPLAPQAGPAVAALFARADAHPDFLTRLSELADLYLDEAASPLRDEALHILFLGAEAASPRLTPDERERARILLRLAQLNRPGDEASDFAFADREGRTRRLAEFSAERILLFFNDPECVDCRRAKALLAASPVVRRWLATGRLALLSVCVEGPTPAWRAAAVPEGWTDGCDADGALSEGTLYYLKTMPTLLLLDAERRVVLKDAAVDAVERALGEAE